MFTIKLLDGKHFLSFSRPATGREFALQTLFIEGSIYEGKMYRTYASHYSQSDKANG